MTFKESQKFTGQCNRNSPLRWYKPFSLLVSDGSWLQGVGGTTWPQKSIVCLQHIKAEPKSEEGNAAVVMVNISHTFWYRAKATATCSLGILGTATCCIHTVGSLNTGFVVQGSQDTVSLMTRLSDSEIYVLLPCFLVNGAKDTYSRDHLKCFRAKWLQGPQHSHATHYPVPKSLIVSWLSDKHAGWRRFYLE